MSTMTIAPPEPDSHETLDPDALYEVINGRRVELPPMAVDSTYFNLALGSLMFLHARDHDLGHVVSETLFDFRPTVDQSRRPDLAFVSFARWPRERRVPRQAAWDVVPDLAIEVVSPFDYAADVMGKVAEYFLVGVRQVWVIYPRQELVLIHDSLKQLRGLGPGEVLDGGAVLSGFRLPVSTLFDKLAEPS